MASGTRPEAIAPAIVPRKKGVTIDDSAKAVLYTRCAVDPVAAPRNANDEPRRMTPNAAAVSGTYNVELMAANTAGKPVQTTTRAKMSQT